MASEQSMVLNYIYGGPPKSGRYTKPEVEAADKLVRVHNVTPARVAELMDFALKWDVWRARIKTGRDFLRYLHRLGKEYEELQDKKRRARERTGAAPSQAAGIDEIGPGVCDRVRERIKRLLAEGKRGPELKEALDFLAKKDDEEAA